MKTTCFECGQEAQHDHHVVPQVKGGTKTVPLCTDCHAKVHDLKSMAHTELTKLVMKRAKGRGVKLGSPQNLTQAARRKGAMARREQSVNAYRTVAPLVQSYRENGMSLARIAERLNEQGITTVSGSRWSPTQVSRVLARSIS